MDFCNIFQRVFKRLTLLGAMSFCLFFVDNVWGRELIVKKSLVVYFDDFGDTELVAERVQERLGADIVRLKTVVKYPSDRGMMAEQMKAELEAKNYFPALVNGKIDLSPYHIVVVGAPVWNGRAAPAIISFLLKNDFCNKKVYFFSIYSGDAGIAIDEMKSACKGATCNLFGKLS